MKTLNELLVKLKILTVLIYFITSKSFDLTKKIRI